MRRAMLLILACIFLAFLRTAESQFLKTIPPASEAGECNCQLMPLNLGGDSDILMPHHSNAVFELYTRSTRGDEGKVIKLGDTSSLANSGFDPMLPLTVVTHGYSEKPSDSFWIYTMKDALLKKDDINVIVVDWSKMARTILPNLAPRYARYTGKILANFLSFIKNSYKGFTASQVHLIGFSYGAQISGIAAYLFPGITRITALDPGAPGFECIPESHRLDSSDAVFVHTIYTDAGCLSRGSIGYRIPTGHQNFYVNGGSKQPGCLTDTIVDAVFDILTLRTYHVCHHHRAVQYYIESIRSETLPYGFLCEDYETFKKGACLDNLPAVLGHHAKLGVFGNFFLNTQAESTFLSRHIKMEVHMDTLRNQLAQGELILKVQSRNGRAQEHVLFRNSSSSPQAGQTYTGMITIPLDSDFASTHFTLQYQPRDNRLLPNQNDRIEFSRIVARDTVAKEEYCLAPQSSIQISKPYQLKPSRGGC